jgi:hypothetical protein
MAELNLREKADLLEAISLSGRLGTLISISRSHDGGVRKARYVGLYNNGNKDGNYALIFSRSVIPLSKLLLNFAHFANWSCALVFSSSAFVVRISVLSFRWRAAVVDWKMRRWSVYACGWHQ